MNNDYQTKQRVFVAGHQGMVGRALLRQLSSQKNVELITCTRADLDLTRQQAVERFFEQQAIDQVYLAAAKVGGIHANNTFPSEFIYQNLMIESNIIHAAYQTGVKKLLFLGSSCIYPRNALQPMTEQALLTGELELTNEPYAIAKIAGIKLCESYHRQYGCDFRSVMPTNLYGLYDNFHLENAHVIPALIHRFHRAKVNADEQVVIWGSGTPKREFMFADDMAEACVFVLNLDQSSYERHVEPRCSHINIGTGSDCSIAELAAMIKEVTGFTGRLEFDTRQPDGTPRKLLDVSRLNRLGWQAKTSLFDGLGKTYAWFLAHESDIRY